MRTLHLGITRAEAGSAYKLVLNFNQYYGQKELNAHQSVFYHLC